MAHAPISWWDKCRKYNHLIGHILNSNFKFPSFQIQNKLLCLPVFVAKRIFKTHQHFCFLCFHCRWHFFWFHKGIEITKNLFTLAENNFGERKLSCTLPKFYLRERNSSPGRAVSLHLARSANQNTEFAAYCPLSELINIYLYLLNSQPRIMHFAHSDWFSQSWLSAHIP